MLERTGYVEALEAERTIEAQGRHREPAGARRRRAASTCSRRRSRSLSGFLQEISLYSDQDAIRGEQSLVTLMTLHNAKGLEFKRRVHDRDGGGDLPARRARSRSRASRRSGASLRRHDARARSGSSLTHATLALALGSRTFNLPVALPRRAAARRASCASGCGRPRGASTAPRDVIARASDVPALATGDSVRHGDPRRGRRRRDRAGRRRHRALRRRRRRAAADARVRAAGEDRLMRDPRLHERRGAPRRGRRDRPLLRPGAAGRRRGPSAG